MLPASPIAFDGSASEQTRRFRTADLDDPMVDGSRDPRTPLDLSIADV